ncbi:hypothetical protein KGM_212641 [Danaus plexippus plexippus]|uniref:Uncharacterized protein n=1 Tax=Danaus plexippus plexippus TaxID=278856 RepID=A0A212FPB1_DANPL|nr:hypothetical protein KGM_212641 [Danaus plexippus plexippus]
MNEATRPETGYPDIEGADFFKGDPLKKAEDAVIEGKYKKNIEHWFVNNITPYSK